MNSREMMENVISEMREILDCMHDRILVLDRDANVLVSNKAFEDLYGNEMNGKNIKVFDDGRFKQSKEVLLRCIESKKKESFIYKRKNKQHKVLVTAIPLIRNGEIDRVIITERDILHPDPINEESGQNFGEGNLPRSKNNENITLRNTDEPVYKGKAMGEVSMLALKVAGQDITVLIQGESGTGKEIIARFIYKNSSRRDKPFIKVNCGAIPENLLESELFGYEKGAFTGANENGKAGLFELANGGTLFLDEIGYLPAQMQVKLLRAIQEREIMRIGGSAYIPVDIRIIAAANTNLKEATEKGEFRSDLYYRLNVVPITLEPLRKRKEDIYPLANKFLKEFNLKYNKNKTIDESGWKIMLKYKWPGNVRELENLVECLVVTAESNVINGVQIAEHFSDFEIEESFKNIPGKGLKGKVEEYEKRLIISQMQYYSRTQELADALRIDKSTLTRKMARYNIKYKLKE